MAWLGLTKISSDVLQTSGFVNELAAVLCQPAVAVRAVLSLYNRFKQHEVQEGKLDCTACGSWSLHERFLHGAYITSSRLAEIPGPNIHF